jgi:hypothetical protein
MALVTVSMGNGLKAWRDYQKTLEGNQAVVKARTDYAPYREACTLDANRGFDTLPREKCIHGLEKGHPKILLWGDSHADHVMPALIEALPDVAVYQLAMAGCPPVIGYESKVPATSKYCAEFNQRVLATISELKSNGLEGIVISARWPSYLWKRTLAVSEPQPGLAGDTKKMAEARVAFQADFEATLSRLDGFGLRVLVLAPNPEMIYSPPLCIGLRRGSLCDIPYAVSEAFIGDPTAALAEVVNRHTNVRFAEMKDFFCDSDSCYAMRNGKVLFIDENHISATTARDLGRFLSEDMNWLLGRKTDPSTPYSKQKVHR